MEKEKDYGLRISKEEEARIRDFSRVEGVIGRWNVLRPVIRAISIFYGTDRL